MTRCLVRMMCGVVFCGTALAGDSSPTRVQLWFDTEDYTWDRSNDAIRELANILTEEGVCGHFKGDKLGRGHDTPAYLTRELELLKGIADTYFGGAALFRGIGADKTLDEARRIKALRMADLAEYMARGATTAVHTREAVWLEHRVKYEGLSGEGEAKARARVKEIARAEYDNARAALEVMRRDSRLGWEPTMEYRGGCGTVEWKLKRMERVYGDALQGEGKRR